MGLFDNLFKNLTQMNTVADKDIEHLDSSTDTDDHVEKVHVSDISASEDGADKQRLLSENGGTSDIMSIDHDKHDNMHQNSGMDSTAPESNTDKLIDPELEKKDDISEQIKEGENNDSSDYRENTLIPPQMNNMQQASYDSETDTNNPSINPIGCYESNKRYVIGDIAGTFLQIPFAAIKSDEGAFHRNDIVADIAQMGNLLVMGASLRGESHYAHRIPRQDSFLIEEYTISESRKYVIAAIADGAGNADKSDDFSEMLVNFLCKEIGDALHKDPELEKLDWNRIAETIWKISVNYCYRKSGSKNIDEYFKHWASTLECVVIESSSEDKANYVSVSICGDGGVYIWDSLHNWSPVKHGKTNNNTSVSNLVYCLPDKPTDIKINKGFINKGDSIFIVTDGLSDYIEEYDDIRHFFGENLPHFHNLPEFIRVLNVAVKQMDDDKTGVLISLNDKPKI